MHDKSVTFHTSITFETHQQRLKLYADSSCTTTWILCFSLKLAVCCPKRFVSVIFRHVKNKIYKVCLHKWRLSFSHYCLSRNTKCDFWKSVLPVITTLQKVLKEIYTILVSHLFTNAVFVARCEIWMKVVSAPRSCNKKIATLLNTFGHSKMTKQFNLQ